MKVIVDTNTVISGLAQAESPPTQVLELWRHGAIELLTSQATIHELGRVLHYPKVKRLTQLADNEIQAFLALYRRDATFLDVTLKVDVISSDPDDNMFIALAVTGGADYLVTGDRKHLLPLKRYEDTLIVSPAHFIVLIQGMPGIKTN